MNEISKKNIYFKLFISTLYLSAFTFGGGYVIITLLKKKFVDDYEWIDEKEMLDLVAIAESCPGPVAINGAIVVGYKLGGVLGVIFSILGSILPPFIILSIVSLFYDAFISNIYIQAVLRGMQSGVSAIIVSVVFDIALNIVKSKDITNMIVMCIAFVLNYVYKFSVVYIILIIICFGTIRTLIKLKRGVV